MQASRARNNNLGIVFGPAQAVVARTVARAELLRRLGSSKEAAISYQRALTLVGNDSERRFLERRLREVLET